MAAKKYVCKGHKGILTADKYKKLTPSKRKSCKLIVGGRKRKPGRPKKWRTYRYRVK